MRELAWLTFMGVAIAAFTSPVARANPEPPATYDARVAGMGGIALTTVDNAAAIYHNPAQLDQVGSFSATFVLTTLLVNLEAPFAGPGTEQDSGIILAPLFFVGAAGEVVEDVTLGFAAYVYTGFGGGFNDVGCISYQSAVAGAHPDCDNADYRGLLMPAQDQSVRLFVTELSLSAQVSLAPNLSLGASLRIPWAQQTVSATQEAFGVFTNAEQNVSGVGQPGVLVGMTYRPTSDLSIAAAYRSKVSIEMAGTTNTEVFGNEVRLQTTTAWQVPHMFRVGVSHTFFQRRLLLAAEFKVQMHSTANQQQVFESTGDLENRTVADLKWKNAYVGTLGAEIILRTGMPLRLGMTFGRSATNPETMTSFSPPPGIQYGFYGGIGFHADPMTLDLGIGWGGGPAHTIEQPSAYCAPEAQRPREQAGDLVAGGGCPGTYDVDSWFVSVSATVDIE